MPAGTIGFEKPDDSGRESMQRVGVQYHGHRLLGYDSNTDFVLRFRELGKCTSV